jgi:site-specific recombinase XerC
MLGVEQLPKQKMLDQKKKGEERESTETILSLLRQGIFNIKAGDVAVTPVSSAAASKDKEKELDIKLEFDQCFTLANWKKEQQELVRKMSSLELAKSIDLPVTSRVTTDDELIAHCDALLASEHSPK